MFRMFQHQTNVVDWAAWAALNTFFDVLISFSKGNIKLSVHYIMHGASESKIVSLIYTNPGIKWKFK